MLSTGKVLREITDSETKAIVIELCSLKSPVKEAVKYAREKGINLISIHPMFGPGTEFLLGKNLILCKSDYDSEVYDTVKSFISSTPVNLMEIDFDKHDNYTRYISPSHLINLIYARLIDNSSIALKSLEKVSGTTFQNQIDVTRNVVDENIDLYFDIQILNDSTNILFGELNKIIGEFEVALAKKDREDFRRMMKKSKDFFSV